MPRADPLGPLQETLGHTFSDKALLKLALTHASAQAGRTKKNNERLEFLGDRVLGLAMAELLCELQPDATEGDLAKQFNRLVQRETCIDIAVEMGLSAHMQFSGKELKGSTRGRFSILADACEAVLAAVFLDGGFEPARAMVRKFWLPRLEGEVGAPSDPKTALQEWAQGRKLGLPLYVEVERAGPDHAPEFTTEVRIEGLAPARGAGPSKRLAEQEAAKALLEREGIWEAANG